MLAATTTLPSTPMRWLDAISDASCMCARRPADGEPVNLFTAHSPVIESCHREIFEIENHRNFDSVTVGTAGNLSHVLDELIAIHPERPACSRY